MEQVITRERTTFVIGPTAGAFRQSMDKARTLHRWPGSLTGGFPKTDGVSLVKRAVHEGKIRKSRGALFVAIVKRARSDRGVVVGQDWRSTTDASQT
jgi:hypothetical protein